MTGALELQFGASFVSLVESSNSTTIPIIMHSLFSEFDADRWNHQRLCGNLLNLLLYAAPAQYLCVVLSEIFKKLEKADDNTMVILTDAIAELLLSNRSPLGYSALDLTGNFLKLVRKQKPTAPEEVRSSIIASRVAPPRTIYSICNAFISVLKNANFALQKYEIIESLISKAFFPAEAVRKSPSMLSVSQLQMERHSVGTVTLNGTEEGHFRSVVWGILFALAEEGSPPTVLRLAFVEVHVRLFEQLFQMAMSTDLDFCLNTIVLWQQLLEHGLPITPNRRERLASPSASPNIEVYSLGKTSVYLLTKSRVVLASMLRDEDLSIVHYSAIFSLLRSLVHECDLPQMAYTLSFIIWLHQKSLKSQKLTFDDRACIALFTCYLERDISHCAGIKKMAEMAEGAIGRMSSLGVKLIEMSDILDSSRSGPIISGYEEFNPQDIVPPMDAIHAAFLSKIRDSKLLENIKGILAGTYSPEADRTALPALQPGSEKGPIRFKQHQSAGNRSNNGAFSRLSQMGGTITSAITAPAFYRSDASAAGMNGGGMLVPPARTLTVSSSSLAASELQTMPASIPIDVLDSQFDELSVRVREKKQHKQKKSLIFFGRE